MLFINTRRIMCIFEFAEAYSRILDIRDYMALYVAYTINNYIAYVIIIHHAFIYSIQPKLSVCIYAYRQIKSKNTYIYSLLL